MSEPNYMKQLHELPASVIRAAMEEVNRLARHEQLILAAAYLTVTRATDGQPVDASALVNRLYSELQRREQREVQG